MEPYRLRLFGGFELSRMGRAIGLTSVKQRLLLSVLAVSHPSAVARPQLVDLLWGSRFEDQARQSLRQALTRLRTALGDPELLVTEGDTVALHQDLIACDVLEFRVLLAQGTRESFRAAAALYRGEFLFGVSAREDGIEGWRATTAEALRDEAIGGLVALAAAELESGAAREAVIAAQRAVTLDEFNEEAHRQLIMALAAAGRRPDAIRQGQRLRDILRRELDTDPDEQTRELIQRLQSREPPQGRCSVGADATTIPAAAAEALQTRPPAAVVYAQERLEAPLRVAEHQEISAVSYSIGGLEPSAADLDGRWELVSALNEEVRQAVESFGGVLQTLPGDGGIAYFGHTGADEDVVASAVGAGLAILSRRSRFAGERQRPEMKLRIGVATAPAVVDVSASDPRQIAVLGTAPSLAAALQEGAKSNSVVVCDVTWERTRQRFSFEPGGVCSLAGAAAEVRTWRVIAAKGRIDRFSTTRTPMAPIVGRTAELATAVDRWNRAAAGRGQVILLEGEAGIGKSRLVKELSRTIGIGPERYHLFQCSARGMNVMLHPIVDRIAWAVRRRGETQQALDCSKIERLLSRIGVRDRDAIETFSFLMGAGGPATARFRDESPQRIREEAIWAVRQCISDFAATGPVLIAVEDVHWMDPTFQHLVEDLLDWIHQVPVLAVLTSRSPQFEEWTGEPNVTRLVLNRLDLSEASELINASLGAQGRSLPPGAVELIYSRSDGVPLFLEELTRLAIGARQAGKTDWEALLSESNLGSIRNLLSARLAALGPAKMVAQAAAVFGRQFAPRVLCRILSPRLDTREVAAFMETLLGAGITRRTQLAGQAGYMFRHALIQKAAYESLVRQDRRKLHKRIFEVVTADPGEAAWMGRVELASHAEQAELIEQAVRLYIEAGRQSSARSAVAEARQLLEHALELCDRLESPDSREPLELKAMASLGPLLASSEGSLPRARRLYEDAVAIARRRPPAEFSELFPVYWGWWVTGSNFGVQRQRAAEVLDRFRDVPEAEIRLQAWHCVWAIDFNLGEHASCLRAIEEGLRLYRPASGGDARILYGGHDSKVCALGQRALSLWLTGAAGAATTAIAEARRWADEIHHVGSIAHVLDLEAMLQKNRRDCATVKTIADQMAELAARLDLTSLRAKSLIFSGWADAKLGQAQLGRELVQQGLDLQAEIGTREDFPVYSEMLAELCGLCADPRAGLELIAQALNEAERTNHRFWVPELHRRKSKLLRQAGDDPRSAAESLSEGMRIAAEQGAHMLLLRAWRTALELRLIGFFGEQVRSQLTSVLRKSEIDGEARAVASEIAAALV